MPTSSTKIIGFLLQHSLLVEASQLSNCRSSPVFFIDTDRNDVIVNEKLCRSRWCPHCQNLYRDQLRARIVRIINDNPRELIRFTTLTQIARHGESLDDAYARFNGYWLRLHRSVWWKRNVQGTILKIECNWNPDKKWWHVHGHLLVDTRWLSRAALKLRWEKITNGAWMVDVRPTDAKTKYEMSAYMTKLEYNPSVPLRDLVVFARGKQFVRCYGTLSIPLKVQYADQGRPNRAYFGDLRHLEFLLHRDNRDVSTVLVAQFVCDHKDDLFGANDFIRKRCREYLTRLAADQLKLQATIDRMARERQQRLPKLAM